jgi:hypothetical protein
LVISLSAKALFLAIAASSVAMADGNRDRIQVPTIHGTYLSDVTDQKGAEAILLACNERVFALSDSDGDGQIEERMMGAQRVFILDRGHEFFALSPSGGMAYSTPFTDHPKADGWETAVPATGVIMARGKLGGIYFGQYRYFSGSKRIEWSCADR